MSVDSSRSPYLFLFRMFLSSVKTLLKMPAEQTVVELTEIYGTEAIVIFVEHPTTGPPALYGFPAQVFLNDGYTGAAIAGWVFLVIDGLPSEVMDELVSSILHDTTIDVVFAENMEVAQGIMRRASRAQSHAYLATCLELHYGSSLAHREQMAICFTEVNVSCGTTHDALDALICKDKGIVQIGSCLWPNTAPSTMELAAEFTEDAVALADRLCERVNCLQPNIRRGDPCHYIGTMAPVPSSSHSMTSYTPPESSGPRLNLLAADVESIRRSVNAAQRKGSRAMNPPPVVALRQQDK
ncbi:hypothetical protein BJ138DRAFT_1108235, partial [Hygrophoropsis aurantiaca]